ncbi:MAG: glycerophosphodiester phosphodiesterase, partial [Candidatus Hydrogenedentes bacterium]|nr:glycerophosphodiester phosphodiesterase [Candidatus Hydrogenedentota bacterium]
KGKIGVYIEVKNAQNDDDLQAAILELAADYQVLPDKVRREMMARIEADGTRNLELTRKVIALVRERKMKKEIVIQSFSPIVCAIASSEAPELRVELLTGAKLDDPGAWERSLRWAYLLGLGGVNPCKDGVDTGRLAALHAGGKCVAVWTVNSHLEMGQLAGWGVDRIITDRPDVCVDTLKKTGER